MPNVFQFIGLAWKLKLLLIGNDNVGDGSKHAQVARRAVPLRIPGMKRLVNRYCVCVMENPFGVSECELLNWVTRLRR
jgi:hypothetical protein